MCDGGEHSPSTNSGAWWSKVNELLGKRGGKLNAGSVHKILSNPIYPVVLGWNGRVYKSVDEAVINRELYLRVQARLDGHPYTRSSNREFAFRGLLTCGHCGAAVTAELKKGKYRYYRCAQRCRKEKYVNKTKLSTMFAEEVVKPLRVPASFREPITAALKSTRREVMVDVRERIRTAQARHERLQGLIDKAYEDNLEGLIDDAFFARKRMQWEREQASDEREMDRLRNAGRANMDLALQVSELANDCYDWFVEEDPFEQRELLDALLSNCELAEGRITPVYRKAFELLRELSDAAWDDAAGTPENGEGGEKWRGGRDSNSRPPA